jgi:[acyl-carrier-protein] S-malonyltransferase
MFEGPSEKLTQTQYSQVAIFVMSMALLTVVQEVFPSLYPSFCAGLSLGEYSALCACKKIGFKQCLELVKVRGESMQEACERHPGSLWVVLGLDAADVEAAIAGVNDIWIANLNCPKQVVIAGTHAAFIEAEALLKEKGAKRVLPLEVSGAFHSGLMKEAQEKLAVKIEQVDIVSSDISIVMNVCGEIVQDPNSMRQYLIEQVVSPTRWEKGIRLLQEQKIDYYLEIGCGKTLSGMNKKIGVTAPTYSIEKIEDLEKLAILLKESCDVTGK